MNKKQSTIKTLYQSKYTYVDEIGRNMENITSDHTQPLSERYNNDFGGMMEANFTFSRQKHLADTGPSEIMSAQQSDRQLNKKSTENHSILHCTT